MKKTYSYPKYGFNSNQQKKIYLDKLFPCPPSRNYNNLMIDTEAVSYITTPQNSDTIIGIIESQLPDDVFIFDLSILDGTACVGGDSIGFGKVFQSVVAIEADKTKYEMLVNNINVFKLYNVIPTNDNTLNIYRNINFVDIMYFDPPWGGKSYKDETKLKLTIGDKYIDEIVNDIFNGNTRSDIKMVLFKLPKNYDVRELYERTKNDKLTIYMYDMEKMLIILYKRNDFQ